jgi:hypothetical protein
VLGVSRSAVFEWLPNESATNAGTGKGCAPILDARVKLSPRAKEEIAAVLGVGHQTVSLWIDEGATNSNVGNSCAPILDARVKIAPAFRLAWVGLGAAGGQPY